MDGGVEKRQQMMEWSLLRCGREKMIEQAKEELEILETQHPNRFQYLKLELNSFISQLHSSHQSNHNIIHLPPLFNSSHLCSDFPTASTQESSTSNSKKRKNRGNSNTRTVIDTDGDAECESFIKQTKLEKSSDHQYLPMKSRDRDIDAVIAKVQACLNKIKHFKATF